VSKSVAAFIPRVRAGLDGISVCSNGGYLGIRLTLPDNDSRSSGSPSEPSVTQRAPGVDRIQERGLEREMLNLQLRDEFKGERLKGTTVDFSADKATCALQEPAAEFLSITYPSVDLLRVFEATQPDRSRPVSGELTR
jgi:hypothetical protein